MVEVTDSEEETEQGQEEEVVGRQTDSQNNYQQEEQRNIPKTVSFNVVTRNIKVRVKFRNSFYALQTLLLVCKVTLNFYLSLF